MDLAAVACAAAALVTLALYLFQRSRRRYAALSSLGLGEKEGAATRPRFRFLPLLEKRLSWLGRMISPRPRGEITEMLTRSGKDWTPHLFQGLRLGMGLASAILVLPLGLPGLLLAPVLFAAGYHAPVMALKRGQRRR